MRHAFTNRVVITVALVALAASVLFALSTRRDTGAEDRVEQILALEVDLERGLPLYNEVTEPSCASCHSLAAAGAVSDRASDLDVLRPSARAVVDSILNGAIRAHEAQNYRNSLSDLDMADLAAYVAQVAGNDSG